MPVPNPLLVFVPSAFALVAFLVSAIVLWKVYKRGGADDVIEVTEALAELRPQSVVARAIEARKAARKLSHRDRSCVSSLRPQVAPRRRLAPPPTRSLCPDELPPEDDPDVDDDDELC